MFILLDSKSFHYIEVMTSCDVHVASACVYMLVALALEEVPFAWATLHFKRFKAFYVYADQSFRTLTLVSPVLA